MSFMVCFSVAFLRDDGGHDGQAQGGDDDEYLAEWAGDDDEPAQGGDEVDGCEERAPTA